jgi:hypothetical protein
VTKQVWLPGDGALLKKLREESGVDITTLARIHSLSTAQVKQLEDGGDSGFYTSAIKLATGRKLLMHFGADIEPLKQASEQIQVLEDGIVLEVPEPKSNTPEITPTDLEKTKRYLRFLLPSFAFIWLGFAFSNVYFSQLQIRPKSESRSDDAIAQPTLKPTIASVPIESKLIAANAAAVPDAPIKTVTESQDDCKWTDASLSIAAYQPTKSGDYVHAVANADGAICICDATGKSQVLHLKTTQSQTVRGRPPFAIFSNDLSQFKLYYQGNLLKLPSKEVKNITLQEQKYE